MIERSYILRHIYIPITHEIFILEDNMRVVLVQCFLPTIRTFYEFFQSETTSKLIVPICFGQVGTFSGK